MAHPPNRLAASRSPYLRQHANNPVDWYPWGPEAFERAQREGRPILLSVGYAACHWCHVMEHESFEDEATAALLNEVFVCVKVDREERPDVDRLYMNAVHVMQQRGGWPMTVLLTPDGKPFWAGTYLPREGLQHLVKQVRKLWAEDRARAESSADRIAEAVASLTGVERFAETSDGDGEVFKTLRGALGADFDATHGGYGSQPKFPPHTDLVLILEPSADELLGAEEQRQARVTLDAIEAGGIHDHVGGGFHRYSTDASWLLPHFEKMLYDNALLAQAYCLAFARTGEVRYRRAAERTLRWVERDLARPGGGYASSLDADTEGEEGLTYTWTLDEVRAVLAPADVDLVTRTFGLEARGNFLDEATHQRSGRNVLYRPPARAAGPDVAAAAPERLDELLDELLAARTQRAQPGLDDKVIAGWNGLLLSALVAAGRDLPSPHWLRRARVLAAFLLEHCRRPDGTLLRFPRDSGPEIVGFCEDHVHVAHGLLDLEAVTGEPAWGNAGVDIARRLLAGFFDAEEGGFFTTDPRVHEALFARTKEAWDSPIPSDNGAAAHLCLRVFEREADARFLDAADRTLDLYRPMMAHPRMSRGVAALLRALRARLRLEALGRAPARRGDLHRRLEAVSVDVYLEREEVSAGGETALLVRLRVDRGWHVTAPGDATGVPLALTLAQGSPLTWAGAGVLYPEARREALAQGAGPEALVYDGMIDLRARLQVPVDAPPGPRRVPLRLTLQPCSDQGTCLAPVELELDVSLRVAAQSGVRRHAGLFDHER